MLFHVGALWRLHELGWLTSLQRISSVSGGSIASGALAMAWPELVQDHAPDTTRFVRHFVASVRHVARQTIDVRAVLTGLFSTRSIAQQVARRYDALLFHGATLADLPDESRGGAPQFVFNASNVQTGALFRFTRTSLSDWHLGHTAQPAMSLSVAVASSSAFPPLLSPMTLAFAHDDWTATDISDLHRPPFTTRVVLTDGGVYDNLGLEPIWKTYRTLLVSDAGGKLAPEERPRADWLFGTTRVLDLLDQQVRNLRNREIMQAMQLPRDDGSMWRAGAYWGVRTDIAKYGLADALPYPHDRAMRLAAVHTRLARLDDTIQEELINWGYAACDAAMRRYALDGASVPPPKFPYPSRAP